MKRLNKKQSIIYPLIVGIIAIIIAVVLVLYYRTKATTSVINYIVNILLFVAGVASIISALFKTTIYISQGKILKNGQLIALEYVSNECKVFNKNGSIYNITFKQNDTNIVSKNEFVWAEVLAIKSAKTIDAKVLNNKAVIITDITLLKQKYAKEMNELNNVYSKAYDQVEQIVIKDSRRTPQRTKNLSIENKQKKEQQKQDLPSAKDD